MLKLMHNIRVFKDLISTYLKCLICGLPFDKTWVVKGKLLVVKPNCFHQKSKIKIGHYFYSQSDIRWNVFGIIQANVLNVRTPGAQIVIGNNVGISGCQITAYDSITICDNVMIGSGCVICDSDAHPISPKKRHDVTFTRTAPIFIEKDVFIGARCIILKGVRIGAGAVIGAGSVVTKDIPPMSIYAGNPAQFIRYIDESI